jgi:N-methylhydantoinase A
VTGLMRKPPQRKIARGRKAPPAAAAGGKRKVFFGGRFRPTPVFWRPSLLAGNRITGPALIEEYASTTLLLPGDVLEVDAFGNLAIRLAG